MKNCRASAQTPVLPRLRLAMVGLGPQGLEHLRAAQHSASIEFVAGVDVREEQRRYVATRFPNLADGLHATVAELAHARAQGLQFDGLVLALPHHAYADVWASIVSFGLPLLKEKPLGRDQHEARCFLSSARAAACPVQTAIQRRHHPSYRYLRDALRSSGETVKEVHAHLHLGFAQATPAAGAGKHWRDDVHKAGGGTLLDCGYHMVDLLHDVVGPFELVASTLLSGGRLVAGGEIEDRVWLQGRSQGVWVMLDSWLRGEPDLQAESGFRKSEGLLVQTNLHTWRANREGVWRIGHSEPLYLTRKDWETAMAAQLDQFAKNIRAGSWNDAAVWEQLPAMRIIDHAYQRALHF